MRKVSICKLFAVFIIASAVTCGLGGEAFAATVSGTGYGPPPVPPPLPPGGFTRVVTTETIGPGGGTIGPLTIQGTHVKITVPSDAFPVSVQITVTAPILGLITHQPCRVVVAGAGIHVSLNGAPYPGRFVKPITVIFRSHRITAASDVTVWNGTSFVTAPSATVSAGVASVSFDTASNFAVETPAGCRRRKPVSGATAPETGKPVLGEGILAGVLVLGGAGGIAVSRRRRRPGQDNTREK